MRTRKLPLALSLAAAALAGSAGSAACHRRRHRHHLAADGNMSPQGSLVQGSLNKLCAGAPVKANVGSLVGILVPVAVQDIPVLSAPQNQQCAGWSRQPRAPDQPTHGRSPPVVIRLHG